MKHKKANVKKFDAYQQVTDIFIEGLELYKNSQWKKSWVSTTCLTMPHNGNSNKNYRGINILILSSQGFQCPTWDTYKGWKKRGYHVTKGSKGTQIYFNKPMVNIINEGEADEERNTFWMLRVFTVFNGQQVQDTEGQDYDWSSTTVTPEPILGEELEVHPGIDKLVDDHKVSLNHGGNSAFYQPSQDYIQMPNKKDFKATADRNAIQNYYGTLCHEFIHWTGHKTRTKRLDVGARFGNESYAFEELVAELGSVFLCIEQGLVPQPTEDNIKYVNSWIKALKNDKRLIIKAASLAQKACDYINGYEYKAEEKQAA